MQNLAHATHRHNGELLSPEQELLGVMFKDADARGALLENCRPAMLRDPFHRRIFETAKHAAEQGETVSTTSLRERLKGDPAWSVIPDRYLDDLRLAAPVTRTAAQLIENVRADIGISLVEGRRVYALRSITGLPDGGHDYLLKGLIAPGEMSVIYGEPGSGKSFMAAWMAYSIATDQSVFGRRVRGAPVVYAALEGQIGFARRLKALRDTLGVSDRFWWIDQTADLHSAVGDIEGLTDAVLKSDAKLLVIDTLARAIGAGSENDGSDMGLVIQAMDQIRRETGAHVSVIHHCGKDNARGMRGHSSLLGATDMAMEVKRTESGSRSMRVVKSKDGKDGDEFGFDLEVVDLGTDTDGDRVTTCIVIPAAAPARSASPRVKGAAKVALDLLDKALAEAGESAPPSNHIPPKSRTIRLSGWRRYCDAALLPENDNPDSKRKAFVRATQKLQEAGLIGIWTDWAWRIT